MDILFYHSKGFIDLVDENIYNIIHNNAVEFIRLNTVKEKN